MRADAVAGAGAVAARPALPEGVRVVRERRGAEEVPLYVHPEWAECCPWLVQGTTGRGDGETPFDLGLFREQPVGEALARWRALREAVGFDGATHAHQVHGDQVLEHDRVFEGLLIREGYDGHATTRPGLLLTISVADCVPISVVDPERRAITLLHGGWRGTARGILARGIRWMGEDRPPHLRVHMGPAVCGRCYEVGPEVHEALGLEVPEGNVPVDVRAVQARQAIELGVPPEAITVSEHCTLCGDGFFSHRAGSTGRQLGILGIRP